MTMFSNHPSWWPVIDFYQFYSYVAVASCTAVMYDWVLTFGEEFDLIWNQRFSFITVLFLIVRYIGLLFSLATMLTCLPSVSVTYLGCKMMVFVPVWTSYIVNTILGVIMIARLYAMYQRSRRILIFLVVTFLALTITCGAIAATQSQRLYGDEYVLWGKYQCLDRGDDQFLTAETWIIGTAWEVIALCLAIRITVKHIRELSSVNFGDAFAVLIKSHVFYFASYAVVSCFSLGLLSRTISDSSSVGVQIYYAVFQIAMLLQMFVLGPRLILSVRSHFAKLMSGANEATEMTPISFQERVYMSTGSRV